MRMAGTLLPGPRGREGESGALATGGAANGRSGRSSRGGSWCFLRGGLVVSATTGSGGQVPPFPLAGGSGARRRPDGSGGRRYPRPARNCDRASAADLHSPILPPSSSGWRLQDGGNAGTPGTSSPAASVDSSRAPVLPVTWRRASGRASLCCLAGASNPCLLCNLAR